MEKTSLFNFWWDKLAQTRLKQGFIVAHGCTYGVQHQFLHGSFHASTSHHHMKFSTNTICNFHQAISTLFSSWTSELSAIYLSM